ncbi:MAG: hypothetical protein OEZ06_27785 [Myxococcales bacterium]|nr:hypothetical protein [Myxococcales bacterium]
MRTSTKHECSLLLLCLGLAACESSRSRVLDDSVTSDASVPRGAVSTTAETVVPFDAGPETAPAPGGQPPICEWPDPDAFCQLDWDQAFESMRFPESLWLLRKSACSEKTSPVLGEATVCACEYESVGREVSVEKSLVRRRAPGAEAPGGCAVYSRKRYTCLMEPGEFKGCDPELPDSSCIAACELVAERHNAIDAPASDAEVLMTGCEASPRFRCESRDCYVVGRIDERCVVGNGLPLLQVTDCSLSPEGTLERAIGECLSADGEDAGVDGQDAGW